MPLRELMSANSRLRGVLAWFWVGALVLFTTGVVAYGLGSLGTYFGDTEEACTKGLVHPGATLREMREGAIPLERKCVFEDGTIYDDIPAWANPLTLRALIGAASCAAVSFWGMRGSSTD